MRIDGVVTELTAISKHHDVKMTATEQLQKIVLYESLVINLSSGGTFSITSSLHHVHIVIYYLGTSQTGVKAQILSHPPPLL